MTDNEIKKALEDLFKLMLHDGDLQRTSIISKALDLINRQKEEIERLQKKANIPFAKITFEMNKLQEVVNEYVKNIEIDINLAKSEAIKEFAERLKEKLQWDVELDNKLVFESDIDNLVEEMTDVETNQRKEDEGK